MVEPTPFLPSFFPSPEIPLFWGLQLLSLPLGLKRYFRHQRGGSIRLTSSPSMTLTHPPFYIALLAVAPLQTFPLLSLLLPFSCSWEVLQNLGSEHLPINLSVPFSLSGLSPQRASLFLQFSESWLRWLCLLL